MKLLSIDIETTPNLAHVWSIWNQNVGLSQLLSSTEMLCFVAKWYGSPKKDIEFWSTHHDGKHAMVEAAHRLVNDADVVMHFNGKRFDVPHLNREFIQAGLKPPAPYKQIDLLSVVKQRFRFPSNKLQYVSKALGLKGKVQHEGHQLWIDCMAGKASAWSKMKKYNIQDVILLEELHDILLPWIPSYPAKALIDGLAAGSCPVCGGQKLQKRGLEHTQLSTYQRLYCTTCSKWFRGTSRIDAIDIREIAA